MDKLLGNLHATLVAGLLLGIALLFAPAFGGRDVALAIAQLLHVLFAVTWLGLLYYLNFAQIPEMARMPNELKPAVIGFIAPRVLFLFRYAALFTVATGLALASLYDELGAALMLREPARLIGVGMWLALVMAFNVWFVVWPAQKRALGLIAVDNEGRARAARTAIRFSRINLILSIPMVLAMVSAR